MRIARLQFRPVFRCDVCGRVNVLPVQREEWSDLTDEELRERLGLEPWQPLPDGHEDGFTVIPPRNWKCRHCQTEYETEVA